MRPIVFLDANVLVPYDLTCVLLAMAEQEILDVKWSERVLEEVRGTLVNKLSFPSRRIERRLDAMQTGFPEAMVVGYEGLERGLSCDPKDRHVLAAAIGAEATHLVTANVKDFDAREVATFDMKLLHPDRFIATVLDAEPIAARQAIGRELARRTGQGDHGERAQELLDSLAKFVPHSVRTLEPDALNLDLLAGWFKPPETRIWPDDAQQRILGYLRERATAGVLLAAGFTTATLSPDGLMTTTWNGDETVNGPLLLELSPFENLAELVAMPLAFNNEEGRQIREHVRSISVVGDFGVGTELAQRAYSRGTGVPFEWLPANST